MHIYGRQLIVVKLFKNCKYVQQMGENSDLNQQPHTIRTIRYQ